MSAIAIIPARGGSRRIPGKNWRDFFGKPIIAYSIETARAAGIFDKVVVSTDSRKIGAIAGQYGAEILWREFALAQDHIGTQEVMERELMRLGEAGDWFDHACCIYPCAPMLKPETLVKARELLTGDTPYVVPVATWLRDPGQFYYGNSNAFTFRKALHGNGTKIVWIDPRTECDINTEEDWTRAKEMYQALQQSP